MRAIHITDITINKNDITILFNVSGDKLFKSYFLTNCFHLHYSVDISKTPPSIAVIPLICTLLPIIWLSNAKIFLNELDEDFYYSIYGSSTYDSEEGGGGKKK